VFEYTKTGALSGTGELRVDGRVVGSGDIAHFTPMRFSITGGGLTCGYEVGPAIGTGYEPPFRCNVPLAPVVVEVEGEALHNPLAEYAAIMSEQ
jgi:hypothetical protein